MGVRPLFCSFCLKAAFLTLSSHSDFGDVLDAQGVQRLCLVALDEMFVNGTSAFPSGDAIKSTQARALAQFLGADVSETIQMVHRRYQLPKAVTTDCPTGMGPETLHKYLSRGLSHQRTVRKDTATNDYLLSFHNRQGKCTIVRDGARRVGKAKPEVVIPLLIDDRFSTTTEGKIDMNAAIVAVSDELIVPAGWPVPAMAAGPASHNKISL